MIMFEIKRLGVEFENGCGTPLEYYYDNFDEVYRFAANREVETEIWYNGSMHYTFVDNGVWYQAIPDLKGINEIYSSTSNLDEDIIRVYIETGSWLTAFKTVVI